MVNVLKVRLVQDRIINVVVGSSGFGVTTVVLFRPSEAITVSVAMAELTAMGFEPVGYELLQAVKRDATFVSLGSPIFGMASFMIDANGDEVVPYLRNRGGKQEIALHRIRENLMRSQRIAAVRKSPI